MRLSRYHFISLAFLALGIALSVSTLIGQSNGGYSTHLHLRYQTEAFMRGSLAVQPVPYHHLQDWAWGNGMQQVWGLGVPLLRLPFELVAKIFTPRGFPDRIVFLLFYLVTALTVYSGFRRHFKSGRRPWEPWSLSVLILFCPAFVILLNSRFDAYEEVISYGCLLGFTLFGLLLHFAAAPKKAVYYLICFLAGFSILVRPTFVAYGAVSFAIATYLTKDRKTLLRWGTFLLALGPLFFLITNALRFGSPFNPGHGLNLGGNERIDFAMKFGGPIQFVPLKAAVAELVSSIFFVKNLNGYYFYRNAIHPWQADVLRFREFYTTTFDKTTLLLLLMSWTVLAALFFLRKKEPNPDDVSGTDPIVRVCGLWSLVSFVLIFAFYVRYVCIASRYIVDFTPAICAGIAALLMAIFKWIPKNFSERDGRLISLGLAIIAVAWIIQGNHQARVLPTHIGGVRPLDTWQARHPLERVRSGPVLPEQYRCGDDIGKFDIHYNGEGWRITKDCVVAPLTAVYLKNPLCVTLHIESTGGALNFQWVQVKFGADRLRKASEEIAGRKGILKFCRAEDYRANSEKIQLVQIGWVDPKTLNEYDPPIRLEAIEKSVIRK